jgi:hypothetical protein
VGEVLALSIRTVAGATLIGVCMPKPLQTCFLHHRMMCSTMAMQVRDEFDQVADTNCCNGAAQQYIKPPSQESFNDVTSISHIHGTIINVSMFIASHVINNWPSARCRQTMVVELSLQPDNVQPESEQHIDYFTQVLYLTDAARYILYMLYID